jgi:hypothetical protein
VIDTIVPSLTPPAGLVTPAGTKASGAIVTAEITELPCAVLVCGAGVLEVVEEVPLLLDPQAAHPSAIASSAHAGNADLAMRPRTRVATPKRSTSASTQPRLLQLFGLAISVRTPGILQMRPRGR